MVGTALKKYAKERNFIYAHGVVYGIMNGFMLTLCEGMGWKKMSVCASPESGQVKEGIFSQLNDPQVKKNYRILNVSVNEKYIEIFFVDNPGTMKKIVEFEKWFLEDIKDSAKGVSYCSECSQSFEETPVKLKLINGTVFPMHETCAASVSAAIIENNIIYQSENKKAFRGALGAFLGAILGAIPWAIVYLLGFFVGWLGFLIGFCAKKGYEMFGGKPGKIKVVVVVLMTIFGVVLGQFLGDIFDIIKYILNGEIEGAALSDTFTIFLFALADPDYISSAAGNLVLGMIFAFLGLWGVIREIKRENKSNAPIIVDVE